MLHLKDRQRPSKNQAIAAIDADGLMCPVSMVVAHPGHELLAYGWMLELEPSVHIVTDGSGRDEAARIEASARLLDTGLGSRGCVFGRFRDLELYAALAKRDFSPFLELRDELADRWVTEGVGTVLCDAYERQILMHDVVQIVVGSAVERANARGASIEFLEMPNQSGPWDPRPGNPVCRGSLTHSAHGLQRKLSAVRSYESPVVQREAEVFLRARGEASFADEALFEAIRRTREDLLAEPTTAWERHGETMLEKGVYQSVIRLVDHVIPLFDALASSEP